VSDPGLVRALSEAAARLRCRAHCHVKVDSGMGRQGVRGEDCAAFGALLRGLPGLRVTGVFSHFASCPADEAFTQEQTANLHSAASALEAGLGYRPELKHLAASAGILCAPETHLDAVRPGAILYGVADRGYEQHLSCFRPVMSLKARIVSTKRLGAGESVGYGRTHVAPAGTRTAVLPIGYADGYPRALGNNAEVLVGGRRCPVVGRISMDCIVVTSAACPKPRSATRQFSSAPRARSASPPRS